MLPDTGLPPDDQLEWVANELPELFPLQEIACFLYIPLLHCRPAVTITVTVTHSTMPDFEFERIGYYCFRFNEPHHSKSGTNEDDHIPPLIILMLFCTRKLVECIYLGHPAWRSIFSKIHH